MAIELKSQSFAENIDIGAAVPYILATGSYKVDEMREATQDQLSTLRRPYCSL